LGGPDEVIDELTPKWIEKYNISASLIDLVIRMIFPDNEKRLKTFD
jgi:hypothetical protein